MSRSRSIAVGLGMCLALVLVVVPRGAAQAQGGDGMPAVGQGQGNNAILILMAPAVQEELKLDEGQKTKVFELARDASRKSREIFQAAFQGGGGNPQALMAAAGRLRQEGETAIGKILKPEQKTRAEEILLRVEGTLAVARPEVADKLNMTRAQNQRVQMTMMQYLMAQREMARANLMNGGGNPNNNTPLGEGGGARSSQLNRLKQVAGQELARILDAKQKFHFNKMRGEPFDVTKIDPELVATPDLTVEEPKAEKSKAKRKKATTSSSTSKAAAKEKAGEDDKPPKP